MTPCIEFDTKHSNGYSTVRWEGSTGLAHRKAYAEAHGLSREELEGVVIRHCCDNRKCINPEHLIAGTQSENMHDRKRPGKKYMKLTREQAATILLRLFIGEGGSALAREYGVSAQMVSHIKHGRQWNDCLRHA